MKTKDIIITIILSLIVGVLYFVNKNFETQVDRANVAYQVYLNGEVIGLISDDQELYNLINQEQLEIKEQYNVDSVYPPNVFEIVEVKTYNSDFATANSIYEMIEERDDFTVKGYTITIKYDENDYHEEEEVPKDFTINVLDKNIFEEALKSYILAFVSEEDYKSYMNNTVEEITDVGQIINNMYFQETMLIKEAYISVNEKIYTDAAELSQDLLFGPDAHMDEYTVQAGDNIESISDEYKLNPQEFLIANPSYRSENTILKIGDTVNVTLLDPIITFIYEVYRIEESVTPFSKQRIVDNTKERGYEEITQAGITALNLNHEVYKVENGEQSSEIDIVYSETVREAVDEITVVGPSYSSGSSWGSSSTNVVIPGNWTWPTDQPSVITSRYSMRWGKLHEGIDISGTGYGSNIYAIGDGVVTNVSPACSSCYQWSNGNYVVVQHENNIYSAYLHLSGFNVREGDVVKKGQVIAYMGDSGFVTGTHLHLGIYIGEPFVGGTTQSLNPLNSIFSG